MYLDFLKEVEGKEIVELKDKGFFAYKIQGQEMHISHLYVLPGARSLATFNTLQEEMHRIAGYTNAKVATATVFLHAGSKDKFLQRLNLYNRVGMEPQFIENNAVIVMKEL